MTYSSGLIAKLTAVRAATEPRPSRVEQEVVALFDELRNPVLRYLLSFRVPVADAEEIVQEAFLLLFRHLRAGKSRENLPGWIFGVAHHLGLKHHARVRREAGNGRADAGMAVAGDPDPAERFELLELQQDLLSILRALPEQDQRCLSLRAEGLRYREIARILGVSLGSVANSLSRSLARLARGAAAGGGVNAR